MPRNVSSQQIVNASRTCAHAFFCKTNRRITCQGTCNKITEKIKRCARIFWPQMSKSKMENNTSIFFNVISNKIPEMERPLNGKQERKWDRARPRKFRTRMTVSSRIPVCVYRRRSRRRGQILPNSTVQCKRLPIYQIGFLSLVKAPWHILRDQIV